MFFAPTFIILGLTFLYIINAGLWSVNIRGRKFHHCDADKYHHCDTDLEHSQHINDAPWVSLKRQSVNSVPNVLFLTYACTCRLLDWTRHRTHKLSLSLRQNWLAASSLQLLLCLHKSGQRWRPPPPHPAHFYCRFGRLLVAKWISQFRSDLRFDKGAK